jgi:hypothetical protein
METTTLALSTTDCTDVSAPPDGESMEAGTLTGLVATDRYDETSHPMMTTVISRPIMEKTLKTRHPLPEIL